MAIRHFSTIELINAWWPLGVPQQYTLRNTLQPPIVHEEEKLGNA
jgi:hypothetical protein